VEIKNLDCERMKKLEKYLMNVVFLMKELELWKKIGGVQLVK
jgi:hypothetical protein